MPEVCFSPLAPFNRTLAQVSEINDEIDPVWPRSSDHCRGWIRARQPKLWQPRRWASTSCLPTITCTPPVRANECWTLLARIAVNTSQLRVASRVRGLLCRAPAVTAKVAGTLAWLATGCPSARARGRAKGNSTHSARRRATFRSPHGSRGGCPDHPGPMVGRAIHTYGTAYGVRGADQPKPAQPIPISGLGPVGLADWRP
jgi:hypothetical protein